MDTETKLKSLLNDIKALKASYPVAASKTKFYISTSETFTSTGNPYVRIKFTPTGITGKKLLVNLRASISIDGNPTGFEPFYNEPQDGTGAVVIRVAFDPYYSSTTYQIKVTATGTTPGTFSML